MKGTEVNQAWLDAAIVFQFGGKPLNMQRTIEDFPVRIEARDQRDGSRKWAVLQAGNCLRKDREWEFELQPSSRTDEFMAMTRWDSREEAYVAAFGHEMPSPGPSHPPDGAE